MDLAGLEGEEGVNSVMSCCCKLGAINCLFIYLFSMFLSCDNVLGGHCILLYSVVFCCIERERRAEDVMHIGPCWLPVCSIMWRKYDS